MAPETNLINDYNTYKYSFILSKKFDEWLRMQRSMIIENKLASENMG